jgi:hypothetical protein
MKLLDVVDKVRELTADAPYAVIGGLAQILWARKTHTDDLDVALSSAAFDQAYERVEGTRADRAWTLPGPPDRVFESDDVFKVCHLLYAGSVVDLISFKNVAFNEEIVTTAASIPELGGVRFIKPELLLVTHLLRPGPSAALSAIELVLARRARGGMDTEVTRYWARELNRAERLERVLAQADALDIV